MIKPFREKIEYGGCMVGQEEREAILRVIDNQGMRRWTIGPESIAFEKELAEATGVDYAVLCNSGSSALLLAISALKLPKGSKVIIPAVNFPTAYSSIIQSGYLPVVVDCDLDNFNLSFDEVKKAIKLHPDTKAVVAVHVAGNPVDLIKLREIVGDRYIVSDNCDGYGGTLNGKFIDTYADVSCISMHAAHIISMGEGGAVLTSNKQIADTSRKMREWGRASGSDTITTHEGFPPDYRERYVYDEMGWNMKPLELQCAMGRVQLKKLQQFKDKRRLNYYSLLSYFNGVNFTPVIEPDNTVPCWFAFPFLCRGLQRPYVMEQLEAHNIEVRTVFSGNVLKHPAYKNEEHIQIGDLKNSNEVMRSGMFIGVPPVMTDEMVEYVGKLIQSL